MRSAAPTRRLSRSRQDRNHDRLARVFGDELCGLSQERPVVVGTDLRVEHDEVSTHRRGAAAAGLERSPENAVRALLTDGEGQHGESASARPYGDAQSQRKDEALRGAPSPWIFRYWLGGREPGFDEQAYDPHPLFDRHVAP